MTVHDVAVAAMFVGFCGAAVTFLVLVGRLIMRRADAETVAAETFVSAADVARRQADDDACAALDEVIDILAEAGIRVPR